jgi:hypothetical protein
MNKDEKVVMYDSPEAATRIEMPGWKSRYGIFYPGDNASSEHGARWSGCTHMTCECGKTYEKGRVRCLFCQAKKDSEEYYALPIAKWDGETPTCDDDRDKYFWDKEQLLDEMYWQLEEAKKRGEEPEMHVVVCEPHYLHLLDGEEWSDDLADDGELSDDVGKAIDAFNAVLKAQGPSCWYPGNERIDMDALWTELKARLAKEKEEANKASEGIQ